MSTVCKIIVESMDTAGVEESLVAYLKKENQGEITTEQIESLYPSLDQAFINKENEPPTHFYLAKHRKTVCEIHYNSFDYCSDIASALSSELKCRVVVLIYQSTAEAGYFALHIDGKKIRSIAFGDGEVYESEGELLDFEEEPVGHDIGEEDETCFVFDSDDLDEYLEKTGIDSAIYGDEPDTWTLIKKDKKEVKIKIETYDPPEEPRPWWKIW